MKLRDLEPTFDEVITLNPRILFGKGDFWQVDNNGVPHRLLASATGDLWTVKTPDFIPLKHKGRKLGRLTVWSNSCELITGIEAHYGGAVVTYDLQKGV